MSIFGGDTGITYEQLQQRKKMAERLRLMNSRTPRNTGEGIHAIARALVARGVDKQANERESQLKSEFNEAFQGVAPNVQGLIDLANSPYATRAHQSIIDALLKGAPNYKRGTKNAKGGIAVVGEEGPEVVELPPGSRVNPHPPFYEGPNDGLGDPPTPEELQELLKMPTGIEQSNFIPGTEFRTADLAGIGPEDMGAAQMNKIQNGAFAYSTLMSALDDYEKTFQKGTTVMPGEQKDALDDQHRNIQMQMKELYNLGVLNGPDLDLMNQILMSGTGLTDNVLDTLGIADLQGRMTANVSRVRKMMKDLIEPKLKAANINIDELVPPKELSDDDFLRELGLK